MACTLEHAPCQNVRLGGALPKQERGAVRCPQSVVRLHPASAVPCLLPRPTREMRTRQVDSMPRRGDLMSTGSHERVHIGSCMQCCTLHTRALLLTSVIYLLLRVRPSRETVAALRAALPPRCMLCMAVRRQWHSHAHSRSAPLLSPGRGCLAHRSKRALRLRDAWMNALLDRAAGHTPCCGERRSSACAAAARGAGAVTLSCRSLEARVLATPHACAHIPLWPTTRSKRGFGSGGVEAAKL